MHFHLPKPLHGWRELAGEISIIVVGVLIALFFEQLVQRWEWNHKVEAAEEAMKHELLWDDGPQLYQRAALHPCIVARLDAIRAAVEEHRSRAELSKVIDGYWINPLTYDTIAQKAADASDVSSHISQSALEPYVIGYSVMPRADQIASDEGVQYADLQAMKRNGGELSGAETSKVLSAVERLRNDNRIMLESAVWALPQIERLGQLDQQRLAHFMSAARKHYGTCVRDVPADFPKGVVY
jgi:hypothetical protein